MSNSNEPIHIRLDYANIKKTYIYFPTNGMIRTTHTDTGGVSQENGREYVDEFLDDVNRSVGSKIENWRDRKKEIKDLIDQGSKKITVKSDIVSTDEN